MSKRSQLLVQNDYPLIASPTLAKAFGVAASMFLQKLHYFLQRSDVKVHQNKKYYFHSLDNWVETLGFYSVSTIKRVIKQLKAEGILIVKKLSKNKWVQTNSYSIDYRVLKKKFSPQIKEQVESTLNESTIKAVETKIQSIDQPIQNRATVHGVQHVQNKDQSQTQVKIANENIPANQTSAQKNMRGLSQPLNPVASKNVLQSMPQHLRQFYRALIQQKIDIHYDDSRIVKWQKYHQKIIRHLVFERGNLGHLKALWYSPEQLGLDQFYS